MSTMTRYALECVEWHHRFTLDVEHQGDITVSNLVDPHAADSDLEKGFAVYRDRTLIKCPVTTMIQSQTYQVSSLERRGEVQDRIYNPLEDKCSSLCKLLPGSISIQIKYTPPR
jgi:hypothetical protein